MAIQGGTTLALALVGPGLVGKALIAQLATQKAALHQRLGIQVPLVAIANSRRMLLSSSDLLDPASGWAEALQTAPPLDLSALSAHLVAHGSRCPVLLDCTASEQLPDSYAHLAAAGISIITPNKQMGAGPQQRYKELQTALNGSGAHFLAEATVGAGLPVLSTLRTLLDTGDDVLKIEGIFSGTLSYIFNTWVPGSSFAAVVADAKAKGFTEPDPRADLSGMDVARKVVILARQCGLEVELDELQVDSLVPEALRQLESPAEFMQRLPEYDDDIGRLAAEAAATGRVVRYVGQVDLEERRCSVRLERYSQSHPFAQLSGADNLVVFTTRRYSPNPLIVRGPGAGADVTAGGVFGDLVHLARCHGAAL